MSIEWTERFTQRMWSSEVWKRLWRTLSCELAGRNGASLERHLTAVIVRVWRYALRGRNLEAMLKGVWKYPLGGHNRARLKMHLETRIRQVGRCTQRQWSCELAARNHGSLEIHLEEMMEWVWRVTSRLWLREFRDMYLEALIERVWRCTWRPWFCKLVGGNRARLGIHMVAMIEQLCSRTWRPGLSMIGRVLHGNPLTACWLLRLYSSGS